MALHPPAAGRKHPESDGFPPWVGKQDWDCSGDSWGEELESWSKLGKPKLPCQGFVFFLPTLNQGWAWCNLQPPLLRGTTCQEQGQGCLALCAPRNVSCRAGLACGHRAGSSSQRGLHFNAHTGLGHPGSSSPLAPLV